MTLEGHNPSPPLGTPDYAPPGVAVKPARESLPLGGAATAALYAVAAAAVGLAIQRADGEYTPFAVRLILMALVAAVFAIALRRRTRQQEPATGLRLLIVLLTLLLLSQFAQLLTHRPDSEAHTFLPPAGVNALSQYKTLLLIAGALAFVGVVAATGLFGRTFVARTWFPCVVIVHFILGVWVIVFTREPPPKIDVYIFQQHGAEALFRGQNPYEIQDYPDIYQSGTINPATGEPRQHVYGPGLSDGERLNFGFPYMPLTLYLAALGRAAAADVRFAHLMAMVVAAALMRGAARNAAVAGLAAVLFLFTPRAFFVLINGWTEPFNVALLAATLYCATRQPKMLPVALGLLIAVKQYMLLVVPLTILLAPPGPSTLLGLQLPRWRTWLRLVLVACAVALAVTLPMVLWNSERFFFSVYEVQAKAPFRWDGLSYLVHRAWGRGEPSHLATIAWPACAVGLAMVLCLWRAPRTPAGFAGSVGLVHLALFTFSKQAFANYYYFVIGAFCCAAALAAPPRRVRALGTEESDMDEPFEVPEGYAAE
jgi:hypothetical protein